ncbi:hypothetical protein PSP6_270155 [Paraburkholderia tropica]|nr:hypothetical protein PSP6_270155 [Paraburkholderia tropica]
MLIRRGVDEEQTVALEARRIRDRAVARHGQCERRPGALFLRLSGFELYHAAVSGSADTACGLLDCCRLDHSHGSEVDGVGLYPARVQLSDPAYVSGWLFGGGAAILERYKLGRARVPVAAC